MHVASDSSERAGGAGARTTPTRSSTLRANSHGPVSNAPSRSLRTSSEGAERAAGGAERATFCTESDLYPAVKAFLERQGYEVKGEVGGCDLVGTRGDEPPVIVELKLSLSLGLVLQGVDRLSLTDRVYLAVPAPRAGRIAGVSLHRRTVRALCRRLGLGLVTVAPDARGGRVEVILDPTPYQPRKRAKRLGRLLGEHARRAGDPNRGGVTRTPIMTAYRQEALRCALLIQRDGQASLRALGATGLVPNAPRILQRDVYGWFRRVERGIYGVTERAEHDIARFTTAGTLPLLTWGAPGAPQTP